MCVCAARAGRRFFILMGVDSFSHLTVLRLIQTVASAGVAAPVFALAADLSSVGGEGRQRSVVTMGFGVGLAYEESLARHSFPC